MQSGDHIFVSKPVVGQYGRFYTHHGIYIGGQQVIHYAGYANGLSSSDADKRVSLVSLEKFRDTQPVQVRQHLGRFSRTAVVQRAKSRLGENEYSLLMRNCEHFATWCWTDVEHSEQVDAMVNKSVTLLVVRSGLAENLAARAFSVAARHPQVALPLVIAGAAAGIGYGLYRLWDKYA